MGRDGAENGLLLGDSAAMRELRRTLLQLRGKHSLNILLLGESGTGKELVARELHAQEADRRRPYIVANMPALPAPLLEAELFGVERGAYTDAYQSRPGKFELADGGDLFLDEIGDLPMEAQAKLLRVLQERAIERVGAAGKLRQVCLRVLSATNLPLARRVEEGSFRADLFYRLGDVVLNLPPLRERREDIPLLAAHFLRKYERLYSGREGKLELSEEARRRLMELPWPGNVRQLESTIKRALALAAQPVVTESAVEAGHAPGVLAERPALVAFSFRERMACFERALIEQTLRKHCGDNQRTMRELGLSRATYYRRLQDLQIGSASPQGEAETIE